MPSSQGKIYLGSTLVAQPGTIDYGPNPNGSITVPGTLLQTYTASGTFTVPAGVTKVHVVGVSGGNNGETSTTVGGSAHGGRGGAGGHGGKVVYWPNVAVTPGQSIAVVVGGAATASSFGALTTGVPSATCTPAVFGSASGGYYGMLAYNGSSNQTRNPTNAAGATGVSINGTAYGNGGAGGTVTTSGGAGTNATNGTGNGGGGGGIAINFTTTYAGGTGGSGRVMIFAE